MYEIKSNSEEKQAEAPGEILDALSTVKRREDGTDDKRLDQYMVKSKVVTLNKTSHGLLNRILCHNMEEAPKGGLETKNRAKSDENKTEKDEDSKEGEDDCKENY